MHLFWLIGLCLLWALVGSWLVICKNSSGRNSPICSDPSPWQHCNTIHVPFGIYFEGFIGIFMPNGYLKVCSTYIITSFTFTLHSIYTGSFKVNQKWPISGLKCIFWCFQNQVGLEPEFRKARFENPLLLLSIKKKWLRNKFKTPGFSAEACTEPNDKINNCWERS